MILTGCQSEEANSPLRWYGLGDSITRGYNSYLAENGSGNLGLDTETCWVALAAKENGWELTNYGVGGSGCVARGTEMDKLSAREQVDIIDFSGADLVTLAFGVNDWKYDHPLGSFDDDIATGGTFYSNMRYCIEKIQAEAPEAKIVVISPLNCCRYGTAKDGWAIGYCFANNGTLEDIVRAEKEVCVSYGVAFIDMLHGSVVVTAQNAPQMLPDGVLPSLECHELLAREIAQKLMDAI